MQYFPFKRILSIRKDWRTLSQSTYSYWSEMCNEKRDLDIFLRNCKLSFILSTKKELVYN